MGAALAGKVALVTGASKGIGAAIAKAMAAAGADVVVNFARDAAAAAAVVQEIEALGRRAIAVQANVAARDDVARLFAQARAALGRPAIVVNNAGTYSFMPLSETTDSSLRAMIDANLLGAIYVCRESLQHFAHSGGAIINIGSVASDSYSSGALAYTASKAGISAVTGVLALELGPLNIRVNQINPGAIDTEGARALGALSDEARADFVRRTPLSRIGTPEDVARVAVFLASDEAGWLTGETIRASGGLR